MSIPTTRALAVVPPQQPVETDRAVIEIMEAEDTQQALAELNGEIIDKFVYVAQGKARLSYAGIKEMTRLYKSIKYGFNLEETQSGNWVIKAYAQNLKDGLEMDYAWPYPKFPLSANLPIEFRACCSKAVRNALMAVLPIASVEAAIDEWRKNENHTRTLTLPAQDNQKALPPGKSTVADAVLAQLRKDAQALIARDPEGAAKIPKALNDCTRTELEKLILWLRNRAAARSNGATPQVDLNARIKDLCGHILAFDQDFTPPPTNTLQLRVLGNALEIPEWGKSAKPPQDYLEKVVAALEQHLTAWQETMASTSGKEVPPEDAEFIDLPDPPEETEPPF